MSFLSLLSFCDADGSKRIAKRDKGKNVWTWKFETKLGAWAFLICYEKLHLCLGQICSLLKPKQYNDHRADEKAVAGLEGSEMEQEAKGLHRRKGKEKEAVVQKMEGVRTRVSYTKEYWDEEKEMLNWKPRQRGKDRMELTLRMSSCCHGNAPSKMRACMQSGFFHFLMSRTRFCCTSFPILYTRHLNLT